MYFFPPFLCIITIFHKKNLPTMKEFSHAFLLAFFFYFYFIWCYADWLELVVDVNTSSHEAVRKKHQPKMANLLLWMRFGMKRNCLIICKKEKKIVAFNNESFTHNSSERNDHETSYGLEAFVTQKFRVITSNCKSFSYFTEWNLQKDSYA